MINLRLQVPYSADWHVCEEGGAVYGEYFFVFSYVQIVIQEFKFQRKFPSVTDTFYFFNIRMKIDWEYTEEERAKGMLLF